mgnify:FL=1
MSTQDNVKKLKENKPAAIITGILFVLFMIWFAGKVYEPADPNKPESTSEAEVKAMDCAKQEVKNQNPGAELKFESIFSQAVFKLDADSYMVKAGVEDAISNKLNYECRVDFKDGDLNSCSTGCTFNMQ